MRWAHLLNHMRLEAPERLRIFVAALFLALAASGTALVVPRTVPERVRQDRAHRAFSHRLPLCDVSFVQEALAAKQRWDHDDPRPPPRACAQCYYRASIFEGVSRNLAAVAGVRGGLGARAACGAMHGDAWRFVRDAQRGTQGRPHRVEPLKAIAVGKRHHIQTFTLEPASTKWAPSSAALGM